MNFYLKLHISQKENLLSIYHFENLKIAIDDDFVWIKNLTDEQINSKQIKILTQKTVYYEKEGKLYLQNSLLPQRNIPSLLWTEIERAIQIELPKVIENKFDIQSVNAIQPKIVSSENEKEAVAMLISVKQLEGYIKGAAAVRLQNLKWVILENQFDKTQNKVFIIGKPILPILSNLSKKDIKIFWQNDNLFIPIGFDFEFSGLRESISEKLKNTIYSNWYEDIVVKSEENDFNQTWNNENRFYSIWNEESEFFLIPKDDFMPLSRSSFKLSFM